MLIQKLRLQRGWSQEELAELSGLSVRTIQRIERGETPSTDSLKAVASVFDVDFNIFKDPVMDSPLDPNRRADEALALAQVRRIKAFYLHAANYAVVVGALALVNLFTSPRYWWVAWVAAGWGIGLVSHGLRAFDWAPALTADWERREVEKRLGRRL